MRTAIASLLMAVLVVPLAAGALIYAGLYDVAATTPHWLVARAILETARVRSIKAHASGLETPLGLEDPAKVLIGVEHYAAHCAVCHGAPGVPKGDIGRGLYPQPPDLAKMPSLYSPPRALLDPQARHQNDRHAGLARSHRRRTLGNRRFSRKIAGHERAGLCQARDGEHGAWRSPRLICNSGRLCQRLQINRLAGVFCP